MGLPSLQMLVACVVRSESTGSRGMVGVTVDSQNWNMGLGRFMLVCLLLQALALGDGHIPTFWLVLCCVAMVP